MIRAKSQLCYAYVHRHTGDIVVTSTSRCRLPLIRDPHGSFRVARVEIREVTPKAKG